MSAPETPTPPARSPWVSPGRLAGTGLFLLAVVVLILSFLVQGGAFGGAWTAYPPLSAKAAYNLTPLGSTTIVNTRTTRP